MENILDRDEEFEQIGKDKSLVITALALERMWMPYWIGIHKTDYTEEECTRHIKITEEWMQMIWRRIECGHAFPEDYDMYWKLYNLMQDTFDPEVTVNEAELDPDADHLLDGIDDCAETFFVEEKFVSGKCKWTVEAVFDMVLEKLKVFLFHNIYESSYEIKKKNEKLSDYIIEHHPALADEVLRVEADKALAQNYPQNMKEILKRRAEYHELNLFDFKPLEEYGFHVEVIK